MVGWGGWVEYTAVDRTAWGRWGEQGPPKKKKGKQTSLPRAEGTKRVSAHRGTVQHMQILAAGMIGGGGR